MITGSSGVRARGAGLRSVGAGVVFGLLGAAGLLCAGPMAHAGPSEAQGEARRELHAGNVRSLRDIERKVLPMMPGMQYLGPEYDPAALAYRLKFIHNGRVVFVDVDARSGQIIHQSR